MWATRSVIHMIISGPFEHRARRPITERLVWPFVVVERKPATNPAPRFGHRVIDLEEDLLVFQAAPQPLDEDVVEEPAFAVHADPDIRSEERRVGKECRSR